MAVRRLALLYSTPQWHIRRLRPRGRAHLYAHQCDSPLSLLPFVQLSGSVPLYQSPAQLRSATMYSVAACTLLFMACCQHFYGLQCVDIAFAAPITHAASPTLPSAASRPKARVVYVVWTSPSILLPGSLGLPHPPQLHDTRCAARWQREALAQRQHLVWSGTSGPP